ncbi:MAG: AI-2E family transporter [Gammaproteobacteria bacterium]|nr:AI-2E family transporter [Gammaproteobacteria bacterium]MYD75054.1 AI-2E family transporter [Gammaproteobacteria bacterium]MYJ52535.1 AI-2E family transporter [Gammaproteobacteria bacterium]
MNIELSDIQKRIIAAGVTMLAAGLVIAGTVLLLYYLARFFQTFESVFLPLAVAAVTAMILEPWYKVLESRMPTPLALLAIFLSLTLPVIAVSVFFGTLIVGQVTGILEQLPGMLDAAVNWFREQLPKLDRLIGFDKLKEQISGMRDDLAAPLLAFGNHLFVGLLSAGSSIASTAVSLLGWIVTPVYLAFFLLMDKIRPTSLEPGHLPFLKPATAADAIYLIREFFSLIVVFFRGQILIALIQGLLLAIGFSIIGLEYGIILGLMLGILNIIPFLGTILGLAICLPTAWFQVDGGAVMASLTLGVFVIVQFVESYVLTPRIMGSATGLNPLTIIVGIFFWGVALNSFLGMILAIPLTAFIVVLWRLAREKYIHQLL